MILATRTSRRAWAAAAVLALAACSHRGSSTHTASTSPSPLPTSSSISKGSPTPTPKPLTENPLTGGKPSKHGVVAVKIDDTGDGRPQANIDKADIVYIEQVEGGLTRLLAVYDSILPTVEAVRSTRANDPELLAQYGPIAYVASGGAPNPLSVLDHSTLKSDINDRGGPGFARDFNRFAPYNLRADLASIATKLKSPQAKYVGFHWSASTAQLKGSPSGQSVRTSVGSTPVAFDYEPRTKRYARSIGGAVQYTAAGTIVSTPNVIVQFCSVTTYYKDIDVNHNPSKYTHTIGRGKVVVFRNGRRITGSWSRTRNSAPTNFTDSHGKPILLRPGGAWVVLVATGTPLG